MTWVKFLCHFGPQPKWVCSMLATPLTWISFLSCFSVQGGISALITYSSTFVFSKPTKAKSEVIVKHGPLDGISWAFVTLALLGDTLSAWLLLEVGLTHEGQQVTQQGSVTTRTLCLGLLTQCSPTVWNRCFLCHLYTGAFTLHTFIVWKGTQGAEKEIEMYAEGSDSSFHCTYAWVLKVM